MEMIIESSISKEKLYKKKYKEETKNKRKHNGKFQKYSSDVDLLLAILIKNKKLSIKNEGDYND
jgi:hypothetical protein